MKNKLKNKILKIGICGGMLGLLQFFGGEILLSQPSNQQRFDNVRQRSFTSDYKAMGIGDAIKVLIVEATEAGNSAGSTESRSSGLSAGVGLGIDRRIPTNSSSRHGVDLDLSSGNNFKGSGANTRKETIRSQLSAKVVGIDERGNFIIEGTRKTKIDGEEQTITLKGLIRTTDVRHDNSVFSYNIMDLELYVEGKGNASKMQQPGLFTKFFRLLF